MNNQSMQNLNEIAALFGHCTATPEELTKPVEVQSEPIQINYYQTPDHATMDLGYCYTWHDLIDIKVPYGKVPQALLMPRVPLPLHHQNPRSILTKIDKYWWERTRKKVYEVQNQHCAVCGCHKFYQKSARKVIEAHELYDIDYKTGTVKLLGIIPVCHTCHSYIHYGRLFAQMQLGNLDPKLYYATMQHGEEVLQINNLPLKDTRDPNKNDNIYNIPWKDWKLVLTIEGQDYEYHSLYENQEDLEAHY